MSASFAAPLRSCSLLLISLTLKNFNGAKRKQDRKKVHGRIVSQNGYASGPDGHEIELIQRFSFVAFGSVQEDDDVGDLLCCSLLADCALWMPDLFPVLLSLCAVKVFKRQ